MRTLVAVFALGVAGLLLGTNANFAQDDKKEETKTKEVVLKGKVCCNKCELGKSKECETVIVVTDANSKKDVVYFFDKASHGKFHDDICTAAKQGTVTGVVKDVEKKKVIAVKKVAYD